MKIATWNVNSLKARLPHLLQWLAEAQPDIVALQETKTQDVDFPAQAIRDAATAAWTQLRANGSALLTTRRYWPSSCD